jgi:hypothetical protein
MSEIPPKDDKWFFKSFNIKFRLTEIENNDVQGLHLLFKGDHWSENIFDGRQDGYLSKISAMKIIHLHASISSKSLLKNASCPLPSWSRN